MFQRIKNWLFGNKPELTVYHEDDEDDELLQMICQRCFETGNMVIGRRDENGKVTIEEVDCDRNEQ